jgi:hypothetical protein
LKSYNVAGGARRDEAKMTVSPTGAIRSNTEGKQIAVNFAKVQGQNPDDFQFGFGGNVAAGQLALYAPKPGDTGLMKVSIYKHAIGCHAGAAFKEFPQLRPTTTVDCHVEESTDADGVPCLVVHVLAGAPTRAVKRKKKGEAAAQGAEKKA